jgi:uncharacterized membrane protein YeaQ/YmgE (transglycosylase-associated protein family)
MTGQQQPMPVLLLVLIALIVMIVLGVVLVGVVLKLLWWAIIGLFIGALARLALPGRQMIGWLGTIGAGIAGAILGGIIAHAFDWSSLVQFLLAIVVAAVLIAIVGGTRRAYA